MIGRTIRNLRIISVIGEGGMGVVYLAKHTDLPKRFAIKCPSTALSSDPEFRERFFREAQIAALLTHPNIVQVTDFFEEGGQLFLVMEYVDGPDLGKVIEAKGKLEEKEALSIFADLLRALEFAHSQGVIHRDIKPSNILIDKNSIARLMDFGIALLVGTQRLTTTGVAGTPCYMSPEQIERPQEVDCRSDIYSLGIVLYQMFTGKVPFEGASDYAIQDQQVHSPAPDPRHKNPAISPEVAQFILKAMAKDPDERFQNCAEFLQDIRDYERKKIIIKPPLWLRVALVVILVSLLAMLFLPPGPQEPEKPPNNDETDKKIALNLIQGGSEKAFFICLEFKRAQEKEASLALVDPKYVDPTTRESIKETIEEHKKNIEEGVPSYRNFLSQLKGIKNDIVAKAFDQYAQMMKDRNSFGQIHTTRLMETHYQQYRDSPKSIDVSVMREACARELGN